jgi:hypothetical protein
MRRTLAATVLVLLLAPEASAQIAGGQPARVVPTQAQIATQATFDTTYLLEVYMTQLASAGAAPTQADINEAARLYFTNGAAATSVPTSGPGAAYFQNGAAATGVPSRGPGAAYFHNGAEVMAYDPGPQVTPAPVARGKASAGLVGSQSYKEDAGVQRAPITTAEAAPTGAVAASPASASEIPAEARTATGLTCSPAEIEAAIAIASQFAAAAAPRPSATCMPSTAPTPAPPLAETARAVPALAAEPAPSCPPGPSSLLARIAVALGGAFCGGLAVALWSRPRMVPRVAQRRPGL